MLILVLQRVAFDFILDILYFPVWWYSSGMKRAFILTLHVYKMGNSRLAPWLWLKNLFVPMYGQTDLQGRVASFIMRLANVIVRGVGLLFWFCLSIIVFLIWPALPAFFLYMLML